MLKQIEIALSDLRKTKPLILNLTNYVTMDFMANALLALGAAPIMSVCDTELEELINIAAVVQINIGTLDDAFIARCHRAVQLAQCYKKPLVLDPVGAGASLIRTKTARELMVHAEIIKGNASEIMALDDDAIKTQGVESLNSSEQAQEQALALAKRLNVTIVVTGKTDVITDGKRQESLTLGSSLMPLITGMGCTLTAIIAAFRAVIADPFEASKLATAYFGLCGNVAELKSNKPGSFRTAFIDALYSADFNELKCHEL